MQNLRGPCRLHGEKFVSARPFLRLAFRPARPIYAACVSDSNPASRPGRPPTSKSWIHEIKHDGYRLIVHRDGKRVRLFTRNGFDSSDRYPLITEAALRNRNASFVCFGME
jgi:ATP-dependent DNA ligase